MPLGVASTWRPCALSGRRVRDGRTWSRGLRQDWTAKPAGRSLGHIVPLPTGVSAGGDGHPCPAERGQRGQLRAAGGSPGPLSLCQLTSVQLPCRSLGVGQCLSHSPKMQETYAHSCTRLCHAYLTHTNADSHSHIHSYTLTLAHTLTNLHNPRAHSHYSPISLTNFQIHTHRLAHTGFHTCAHTFS